MRKVMVGVLLLAVGAIVGALGAEWLRRAEGPRVAVLLRDGDGLRPGDAVTHGGELIGRVEDVSAEGSRVRVAVRLAPSNRTGLTRASTFQVERDDDERRLEAHVLDAAAPPISDGDVIEGVASHLELTLRKAALKATKLIDQAAESRWVKDGARRIDRLITEIEATDWEALGRQFDGKWQKVESEMRDLAARTRTEAKSAYRRMEPEIDRLVSELEAAGKSEEAQALKRRIEDLWREDALPAEATPTPAGKAEK